MARIDIDHLTGRSARSSTPGSQDADAALAAQFPGDRGGRQPVHTVYVAADRYHDRLVSGLGRRRRSPRSTRTHDLFAELVGDDEIVARVRAQARRRTDRGPADRLRGRLRRPRRRGRGRRRRGGRRRAGGEPDRGQRAAVLRHPDQEPRGADPAPRGADLRRASSGRSPTPALRSMASSSRCPRSRASSRSRRWSTCASAPRHAVGHRDPAL